ncbi:uncharacterized protein LOC143038537 isoform X2 [Oratosquilla oratoria]|uniref:uncharacterized protein LOC143038537 isoform X2 n=1 Tax=Oratosquilla oratoria TaxID=337810 RepID=UPI003F75E380
MADTKAAFLEGLSKFIESSERTLEHFLDKIGWSDFKSPELNTVSDVNSFNREIKLDENKYSEELILPSYMISKEKSQHVIIDAELQKSILEKITDKDAASARPTPSTASELSAEFDTKERLALYEYVIKHTTPPAVLPLVHSMTLDPGEITNCDSKDKGQLSHLELMKLERDLKRRRQAYRTKVSTKNKSYSEVLREVVASMMELVDAPSQSGTQLNNETSLVTSETEKGQNQHQEADYRISPRHDSSPRDTRRDQPYSWEDKKVDEKRTEREKSAVKLDKPRKHEKSREPSRDLPYLDDYHLRQKEEDRTEKKCQEYEKDVKSKDRGKSLSDDEGGEYISRSEKTIEKSEGRRKHKKSKRSHSHKKHKKSKRASPDSDGHSSKRRKKLAYSDG